jgi:6,7-dimethyl-8-ribityllumazine synthase
MNNISIILGKFHESLIKEMLAEAKVVAGSLNIHVKEELWVPGSYEVPLALKRTLSKSDIHGAVLLGIIERGETKHGLVMAQSVFSAVIQLQLETNKPVGIGIIGPEVLPEQIRPRLLPHARAAVEAVASMLVVPE